MFTSPDLKAANRGIGRPDSKGSFAETHSWKKTIKIRQKEAKWAIVFFLRHLLSNARSIMKNSPKLFDKTHLKAIRNKTLPLQPPYDFLHKAIEEKLVSFVDDFQRDFKSILLLCPKTTILCDYLINRFPRSFLVVMDLAPYLNINPVCGDEEQLPFKNESFDLILSVTHLHMTNDIPGALKQIYSALKSDGIFVSSLVGGQSLIELKESFFKAEEQQISLRIIPMIEVKQWGDLLKRAGFLLPGSSEERYEATYNTPIDLLRDLKKMGETNTLLKRSKQFLTKSTLDRMENHYKQNFTLDNNQIVASFDILFGWGFCSNP